MFCEKCGAKIEDDSLFCSECGHKVNILVTKAFNPEPTEDKVNKEDKNETKTPVPKPTEAPITPRPVDAPKAPVSTPRPVDAPKAPVSTPKPVETPKAPLPQPGPAPKQTNIQNNGEKKSILPIIIIAIIVVLVIVAGVFIFLLVNGDSDSDSKSKKDKEIEEVVDDEEKDKDKDNDKSSDSSSEKEKEEAVKEVDINEVIHATGQDFIAGNKTLSLQGNDFNLNELMSNYLKEDSSFEGENGYKKIALGVSTAEYAFADFNYDKEDEFIIGITNSNGFKAGNEMYVISTCKDDVLNAVAIIKNGEITTLNEEFLIDVEKVSELSFEAISDNNYADLKLSPINETALDAYYNYIAGSVADTSGERFTDVTRTNDVEFYFLHSVNNDVPLLVFSDVEHKFPPSTVVYYKDQLVRLVFFKKWTFTTVDEGSYGGSYKDSIYTSETPWGASGIAGNPLDMTFYRIDNVSFAVTTKKVLVCASEAEYQNQIDANPDWNHYGSYNDYMNKIKSDFPESDYEYIYAEGDKLIYDNAAYDSYDAICDMFGATDNFKSTVKISLQ